MKYIILIVLMFFFEHLAFTQNAPVTKAGSVLDATAGSITTPVSVTGFENIGGLSLKLTYDPLVVSYVGSSPNSILTGMLITNPEAGTILVSWDKTTSPVTLFDGTTLFELSFTYISGSTYLSWSDDGTSCEYTDGDLVTLTDTPTSDFYIDGYITNHAAPVTYAPLITDATTGSINVPITVDNFVDIGDLALSLEYDPDLLSLTGNTQNPAFGTSISVSSQPSTAGKEKIVLGWSSVTPVTLADGSTLITLQFNYSTASSEYVNYSELTWLTDGASCNFKDDNAIDLYDLPYEDFYLDGLVAEQVAPKTYLPVISNAVAGNNVIVPVTVTGFENIAAVTLYFEYDASAITYVDNIPNSVFNGGVFDFDHNGNIGLITIAYFGPSVSVSDMESIADIEFTYNSGTTNLSWKTDDPTHEYGDVYSNTLWDSPNEDYYFDGFVAGQVAPVFTLESARAEQGKQISLPLRVEDFDNITSLNLTLDYDAGILSYLGTTPNNNIATNFNDGTNSLGRIQVDWTSATPLSLSDETILLYLNFDYDGGTTLLTWNDSGSSCEIKADIPSVTLYDQPPEDFYLNGIVNPADFTWLGATSNDWQTASNWSGNSVPDQKSVVSIPSTPPAYWPVFTGDFTLGNACTRIELGVSSEMTVTGDFAINPGNAFINDGSGILRVGGDWLNSGVFIPKTGEVVFTSQTGGYIPDGVLPAQEVQNYLMTTEPASMTAISGGTAGPTGDNAHSDVQIGFNFNFAGTDYNQVRINTNGWISLNLSGSDTDENEHLFFATDPATVIAPWWDNLLADGSSAISYLTSGISPNRIFTVEWNNMLSYNSVATTRINFQLKLFETTNEIDLCYGTVVSGTNNPDEGASIGIKGLLGGSGDFIEASSGTTNTVITNLTNDSDWPVVNYKFSPPPDTVTFYKMTLDAGSILNIETDVKVSGENP